MSTAKTQQRPLSVAQKTHASIPHQISMPHNIELEESILGQPNHVEGL